MSETASPMSYSAVGFTLPSSRKVIALVRTSAEARVAHSWLNGINTEAIDSNFSSPRNPSTNCHGCALNALGAHRAASKIAVKSSAGIVALSS